MMYYWVKYNQLLLWLVFRTYIIISSSNISVNLRDIDNRKGHILAANHLSYLDSFIIPAALPFKTVFKLTPIRFMAYRELFKNPFQRFLLKAWGSFPTQEIASLQYGLPYSLDTLAKNQSIAIFPEGRRRKVGEEPLQAKRGVSVMAAMENSRVIIANINWDRTKHIPSAEIYIDGPRDYRGTSAQAILDDIYALAPNQSSLPDYQQ